MNRVIRATLLTVFLATRVATALVGQSQNVLHEGPIVFVCEHGAAKSVIAAAYFNKLAVERGLRYRAIYRGANPQAELSVATLKGLREDGLSVPTDKPAPILPGDIDAATYIFAIGCALPAHASSSGKAETWTDVPEVSEGYAATREAIKRHVEHLIEQLQKR